MPLAPYSEMYWYPNGELATGAPAWVFPRESNVPAALYTDATGATPLPNPLQVGAGGILAFWVDNGDYWIHAGGCTFRAIVDTDGALTEVWPMTFVHEHTTPESVWTINHGLGSEPAVTVVSGGQILFVSVEYTSTDALTIDLGVPMTGTAYLRR